jgi:hypothetical protein
MTKSNQTKSDQINQNKILSRNITPRTSRSYRSSPRQIHENFDKTYIKNNIETININDTSNNDELFTTSVTPLDGNKNLKESYTNNRIKYISTDTNNFKNFFSFGNKLGQNYNTELDNDLKFSESTRQNKITNNLLRNQSFSNINITDIEQNNKLEKTNYTKKTDSYSAIDRNIETLVDNDSKLKLKMSIGTNEIINNQMINNEKKIPKASAEYWDNTKRRNLDTSTYTNNPSKIGGKGFGDVNKYDLYLNGVGATTRQDTPDTKPRNQDNDRIFLTNHNYNYDKFHVTENLSCGQDTRYLNKKMI